MNRTRVQRFNEKYRILENGCWQWTGYCQRYGQFTWSGSGHIGAHVASYRLFVGPVEEGKCVLHTCDNPPCVNPDHLFLGTHAANVADKQIKNRQAKGDKVGRAKLTEADIYEIITLRMSGLTLKDIGHKYGVTATHIMRVVRGDTWRHVILPPHSTQSTLPA